MLSRRLSQKPKDRIWFFFHLQVASNTVCSFFGRIYGAPICLRFHLTFSRNPITHLTLLLAAETRLHKNSCSPTPNSQIAGKNDLQYDLGFFALKRKEIWEIRNLSRFHVLPSEMQYKIITYLSTVYSSKNSTSGPTLKVSKSRKQFMVSSIRPKNERFFFSKTTCFDKN